MKPKIKTVQVVEKMPFNEWHKYLRNEVNKIKGVAKRVLFIALVILAGEATAQTTAKIDFKREILPICAFFGAGVSEGTAEALKWHYEATGFKNDKYWNPEISWRNKYKNGNTAQGAAFFGSTTFLVWTTDGYHLARSIRSAMIMTGVLLTPDLKGQRWYIYIAKAVMYSVAYTSGFHLSYSLIFKP